MSFVFRREDMIRQFIKDTVFALKQDLLFALRRDEQAWFVRYEVKTISAGVSPWSDDGFEARSIVINEHPLDWFSRQRRLHLQQRTRGETAVSHRLVSFQRVDERFVGMDFGGDA